MNHPLDRRQFLRVSSTVAASAGVWTSLANRAWTADTASLVRGKDARLIVHNRDPIELETPIELLRQHEITPESLIFIRNNQALDGSLSTAPAEDPNWTIEIDGLVEFPRSITVAELAKLEQIEHVIVLQCSGNGRAH